MEIVRVQEVCALLVSELIEVLSALPGGDPLDWSCAELAEAIPALVGCEARLARLRLGAVAAFDAAGGAQLAGARSTSDWLTRNARVSHAGAMVATARALRDDLPATAAAFASGCISEDHVRVIRRGHRIFGDDFARIEASVVEVAAAESVAGLRRFVDLIIEQYRPDDFADDQRDAYARRSVFLSRSTDGWWHLSGLLDPATGHRLQAALEVFAEKSGEDDERSAAARRADGLGEIAARAVSGIDRPSGSGQVVLHLDAEQLETGRGVAWPSGDLVGAAEVGRVTCSAGLALVVSDADWQPLAVGMTARYASAAQRLAISARDGQGCVHPGCSTRSSRCIAHHIVHWKDTGPTDVSNLVLLCEHHHRAVHHGKLHIVCRNGRMTTSRRPEPA